MNQRDDIYKVLRRKLRQYLERKKLWSGQFQVRKQRLEMFDRAISTHERVLSLLVVSVSNKPYFYFIISLYSQCVKMFSVPFQTNQYDNALGLYENFFQYYANRDLIIDDKKLEKIIVATLLFNMGTLHILDKGYDMAVDFITEAVSYLKQIESDDQENFVSDY